MQHWDQGLLQFHQLFWIKVRFQLESLIGHKINLLLLWVSLFKWRTALLKLELDPWQGGNQPYFSNMLLVFSSQTVICSVQCPIWILSRSGLDLPMLHQLILGSSSFHLRTRRLWSRTSVWTRNQRGSASFAWSQGSKNQPKLILPKMWIHFILELVNWLSLAFEQNHR